MHLLILNSAKDKMGIGEKCSNHRGTREKVGMKQKSPKITTSTFQH